TSWPDRDAAVEQLFGEAPRALAEAAYAAPPRSRQSAQPRAVSADAPARRPGHVRRLPRGQCDLAGVVAPCRPRAARRRPARAPGRPRPVPGPPARAGRPARFARAGPPRPRPGEPRPGVRLRHESVTNDPQRPRDRPAGEAP